MRRITSEKVRKHVACKGNPLCEEEILSWASSSPSGTVRMYLNKLVRENKLRYTEIGGTKLYWNPSVKLKDKVENKPNGHEAKESESLEPEAKKLKVLESEIGELKWVNSKYDDNVKVYMDKLHRYNETKDTTQDLLGRLATRERTTVKELHERFGLDPDD